MAVRSTILCHVTEPVPGAWNEAFRCPVGVTAVVRSMAVNNGSAATRTARGRLRSPTGTTTRWGFGQTVAATQVVAFHNLFYVIPEGWSVEWMIEGTDASGMGFDMFGALLQGSAPGLVSDYLE